MVELIDEKRFIVSLKQGDERAFAAIYQKYHKQLYIIGLKYLKDEELAKDLVQEIFIKLWTYRVQLREDLSLKGFLITATRNLVLNIIRNRKAEILKHFEIIKKTDVISNVTAQAIAFSEYNLIAEQGINQLSPAKQNIFRLRALAGLSNAEVALQLGLSINTVKFQYSQASKFLRSYLKTKADI